MDTVTFGIPLIGRSLAQDWGRILHHLNATIGSIYRQTDPDFRIIIAGTDRPELAVETDARLEFLHCEQLPPMTSFVFIADAARKRYRIAQRLRELGGGYLMFADADDVVSARLVEFVRRDRDRNGYVVADGYMFDAVRGLISPFPFLPGTAQRFDQECGTCTILFLTPDELPARDGENDQRFGYLWARGHPGVAGRAINEGRPLREVPFRSVVYVRNTGENISTREAATADFKRIAFQAYLDDGVTKAQVRRTADLDAEFNLKAAEALPQHRSTRHYEAVAGLSVLIATHKRPAGLRRLLAALRPQVEGRPERKVVVVNDRSHDEAYAAVAAEFADIIAYRQLGEPGGVVAARNACIELAPGAYSVFTDDDCVPPPWWLDWLTARLRLHPEADVVVGTTQPLWSKKNFREKLQGEWFLPRPWQADLRDVFVTANVAVRTSLLYATGGFGFATFAGAGEDTDLSIRLHRAGARFIVDRNWWVAHEVGDSLRTLLRRFRRYGAANARIGSASSIDLAPPFLSGADARNGPQALRALARYFSAMSGSFPGNRVERVLAAAMGTAVQWSFVRGYLAEERRLP